MRVARTRTAVAGGCGRMLVQGAGAGCCRRMLLEKCCCKWLCREPLRRAQSFRRMWPVASLQDVQAPVLTSDCLGVYAGVSCSSNGLSPLAMLRPEMTAVQGRLCSAEVKENAVRRAGSTPARSRFSSETDSAGHRGRSVGNLFCVCFLFFSPAAASFSVFFAPFQVCQMGS